MENAQNLLQKRITKMAQDSGCSLSSSTSNHDEVIRKDKEEQRRVRADAAQTKLEKSLRRSGIPKRFSGKDFDSYEVTTDVQNGALITCHVYAQNFHAMLENGVNLVLAGAPGTGKTHLAVAILRSVLMQHNTGLFVSVSEMLRFIRTTYGSRSTMTEEEAFDSFITPTLLVLDEVGVTIGDEEKRKAMVFDVLNARYNAMRPTVIIGNLTTSEMKSYLGERVWDRLMEGGSPVLAFTGESYRQKASNGLREIHARGRAKAREAQAAVLPEVETSETEGSPSMAFQGKG